jgi:hypothetical protein
MCAAGIDIDTEQHIRPVSAGGRLSTNLLTNYGGPFEMAVALDIGTPRPLNNKPQVEDHIIDPTKIKSVGIFPPRKFWKLLNRVAKTKLKDIFGRDLIRLGSSSCGVEVGKGSASLGCLTLNTYPSLYIQKRSGKNDQVRMNFTDDDFQLDCGVTDIRLYGHDHVTPEEKVVEAIAQRLNNTPVILSMGLTRALRSSPDFDPVHWLQVNNIHFEDDPTWQLV